MSRNITMPTTERISQADLATLAQQFTLQLFNQKNDARLVFHTYRQTLEIAKTVTSLAEANRFTEAEWEAAELAAWFVNSGYLFDYHNPAPKCQELAEKFFNAHDLPDEKKAAILTALKSALSDPQPKTVPAQLLSDAMKAAWFGAHFFENSPLLHLERELMLQQHSSKNEWAQFQMQQLLNARFYTSHGKVTYEPIVANHLVALRQRLEKQKDKQPLVTAQTDKKFKNLETKTSVGTQTFFRTNYRTHINLSAIADNKANIMITVNAILISILISMISYRNLTETNPGVLMPVVLFLVTGLTSLIFAVLAARPKITSIVNAGTPLEEAKRNIVFFGNFVSLDLDRYEQIMDEVFKDSELLYGNLTRDLYYLGKVLDKKYRYLSVSYNIFMVGFVATVLTFLAVLFT